MEWKMEREEKKMDKPKFNVMRERDVQREKKGVEWKRKKKRKRY